MCTAEPINAQTLAAIRYSPQLNRSEARLHGPYYIWARRRLRIFSYPRRAYRNTLRSVDRCDSFHLSSQIQKLNIGNHSDTATHGEVSCHQTKSVTNGSSKSPELDNNSGLENRRSYLSAMGELIIKCSCGVPACKSRIYHVCHRSGV